MPLSRRLLAAGEDPYDWESQSENENVEDTPSVTVPDLLPVPASLAKPGSKLCDTCTGLDLSPRRFVVLPGDPDAGANQPDKDNIKLGPAKDVKDRSKSCPFCRLVLKAISNVDVPEVQDGESVYITMSWNTDGPKPDPERPWSHIPQIRVLRPYVRTESGGFVDLTNLNMFPEITLLANDAPTPLKSYFARLIPDQIDFGMVRNWLTMCRLGHGDFCNQSRMLDHEISDPAAEIPSFRLIDVIDNCIVPAPNNCTYVGLSYVWGNIDPSAILRLLKSNLEDLGRPGSLVRKDNFDRIPKTIQDALQVVRELHLRYLWTDSLCIIQDDDGERGSKFDAISKMDLVYGAAYLTIVAAGGADANVGLPGVYPGTRGMPQVVEELGPGFRLAFKAKSEDYVRSSVYHTRGWTYQEQMFLKRKLTFVGGQVEFGCRKAGTGWREDNVFEDRYSKHQAVVGSSDKDPNDIGDFEGLISTYSGLSLKFHDDIYNAFAGITRYFKSELQAGLCHGIPDKFFDWFLIWQPQDAQTRRDDAPSWSWSGWNGGIRGGIWDWYERNLKHTRAALRKRTWIIWYQRTSHDSVECRRLWTPKADPNSPAHTARNFYGGHVQEDRFPFDCTQTTPTLRILTGAPTYIRDAYHPSPGSGFLQFSTVSAEFKVAEATSKDEESMPVNGYTRLGIFGRKDREVGIIFINPTWCKDNVPKVHEFILICEARDKRVEYGRSPDEERGWRYMVMLIEWHGNNQWAERIAVGWIKKQHLNRALNGGAMWKEIVLG
ncbi:hypothetical protein CVT26_003350 [Gymnopilus dilepis]|uniref:Heterokaryon incompatibility domain-containing protein n=1 Tax=Gymnopilus dilepis TaxID=231916 RepID=A0A409VQJ6_9AGAR|nr:hypothetical protein CVT26_003350 [Gymnopilus dilepis]